MIEAITATGLITFAITYLLKDTNGPNDMFLRLRLAAGIRFAPVWGDHDNVVDTMEEASSSFLSKVIICWWCFSTWIALFTSILYTLVILNYHFWSAIPFIWFGAIAIAGIIHKFIEA